MAKPAAKEKPDKKHAKAVAEVVDKEISKEEKLLAEARQGFKDLQLSWFKFAKAIWMIRSLEAYKDKYDNFKDYCAAEFPSTDYSTLLKYCVVAENFSAAIEEKLSKDENYILPSYHSFYLIASKQESVKKEELSKYRKMVLDAKIGYHNLRTKLNDLIVKRTEKETLAATVRPIDDIEKSLEKDIQSDIDEAESLLDREEDYDDLEIEDDAALDEDIIEEDESEEGATVEAIMQRVNYLKENLPLFEAELTKKLCAQDDAIDLAEALNDLGRISEKFLTKFEKLNK